MKSTISSILLCLFSCLNFAIPASATPTFASDNVNVQFTPFSWFSPIDFGTSPVLPTEEFSKSWAFAFVGGAWDIHVDIFETGIKFHWDKAPNNFFHQGDHYHSDSSDIFAFDIRFSDSILAGPGAITYFSSTGPFSSGQPSVGGLYLINPHTLHIGFNTVDYGDTYIWKATAVPEPTQYAMLIPGLLMLIALITCASKQTQEIV